MKSNSGLVSPPFIPLRKRVLHAAQYCSWAELIRILFLVTLFHEKYPWSFSQPGFLQTDTMLGWQIIPLWEDENKSCFCTSQMLFLVLTRTKIALKWSFSLNFSVWKFLGSFDEFLMNFSGIISSGSSDFILYFHGHGLTRCCLCSVTLLFPERLAKRFTLLHAEICPSLRPFFQLKKEGFFCPAAVFLGAFSSSLIPTEVL